MPQAAADCSVQCQEGIPRWQRECETLALLVSAALPYLISTSLTGFLEIPAGIRRAWLLLSLPPRMKPDF